MKKLLFVLMCLGLIGVVRADETVAAAAQDVATNQAAVQTVTQAAEQPAATTAVAVVAEKPVEKAAPKFIVILPEQMDSVWYWNACTTESQHLVQSVVEKALVDAGVDLIDISTLKLKGEGNVEALLKPSEAADKAREAGAMYVIVGSASAVENGSSTAYGTPVARSLANASAKIVRVSDGKVISMEEAEANEGAQGLRAAEQAALKKVGGKLADRLATSAKNLAAQ